MVPNPDGSIRKAMNLLERQALIDAPQHGAAALGAQING
jgi:hypothetical protein